MLFMVLERFKNRDARAVYQRFRDRGRMLPPGVTYIDSWVETTYDRCFQLMECEAPDQLQPWIAQWADLVNVEVIPVVPSEEAWRGFAGHGP